MGGIHAMNPPGQPCVTLSSTREGNGRHFMMMDMSSMPMGMMWGMGLTWLLVVVLLVLAIAATIKYLRS